MPARNEERNDATPEHDVREIVRRLRSSAKFELGDLMAIWQVRDPAGSGTSCSNMSEFERLSRAEQFLLTQSARWFRVTRMR